MGFPEGWSARAPAGHGSGRSKGITKMKGELLPGGRVWRRAAHLVAASLSIAVTGAVGGCLSRPLEPIEPKTTSVVVERLTESSVDKIDLLLMIDNSRSMADKQKILIDA